MAYLRTFSEDDVLSNTLTTYPEFEWIMLSGNIYLNDRRFSGFDIKTGTINLFEMNVDRGTGLINPYVVKNGDMWRFSSITTSSYDQEVYGTKLTGAYPYTASISREFIFPLQPSVASAVRPDGSLINLAGVRPKSEANTDRDNAYFFQRKRMLALKNTLNSYQPMNPEFKFTGSFTTGSVNLLSIPSIAYGSKIDKGSVSLKFFFTGTLVDEALDKNQDGILYSTKGPTSGSSVGVVLYNEGFVLLTSETTIGEGGEQDTYTGGPANSPISPKWLYFGSYLTGTHSSGSTVSSSLFSLSYKGTNTIPNMTMFADAPAGELNNSQNTTWLSASTTGSDPTLSIENWRKNRIYYDSGTYSEPEFLKVKNTVKSQYSNFEEDFEKQVFISQVGIFDEKKNLIGIAKLANPVLKKESDSYTFKLKLDL